MTNPIAKTKVVSDFTALLQTRNAFDLGGLYWSTNLFLSQASVVACTLFYHIYYDKEGTPDEQPNLTTSLNDTLSNSTARAVTRLSEEQLKSGVGGLFAIFLTSFILFIVKIDRKYVKTFSSSETGHAKAKRYFLQGKDDYTKSQVLTTNKFQWSSIRPQVAQWLDQNWDRWEREKPDWFNAVFIDRVDDDIMPARVLARLKQEAEGGVRRRSSFVQRMSARDQENGEEEERGSDSDSSGREEED